MEAASLRWGYTTMPTYQYRCKKCGEEFELSEHMTDHTSTQHECPKCKSKQVDQVMTPFFAKTSRKS
ncbi:hypothetical protein L861_16535 [Litchfieldella anticariensis FP35 = DSM 16096]|uniref:C2H2-type domain-containing protein n=2 Tax=Litchfieldella TaxID=3137764 RepID=S2KI23_LITA3|nr:hypothetical protein L861_16535 [Halomonas anticariensis FP35 = DSM 16096]